jgi:hypothetical protein
MAQIQYAASTGATPFTSTTAVQTVFTVVSAATDCGVQLKKYRLAYNGTTATNPPVTVRFFSTNNATAGTGTALTIGQVSGRVLANTNITALGGYTAEPTVKTYSQDAFLLTPNGGTVIYDFPLGDEPDIGFTSTIGLEHTASVAVGTEAALWFTRI